jgi:hypothetical protein
MRSQHIVVTAACNVVIRDNKIIPIATELFLASPFRVTQLLTPIRIVKITNALKHPPLYVVYLLYHSDADDEISNPPSRMLNLTVGLRQNALVSASSLGHLPDGAKRNPGDA